MIVEMGKIKTNRCNKRKKKYKIRKTIKFRKKMTDYFKIYVILQDVSILDLRMSARNLFAVMGRDSIGPLTFSSF